ncbi:MAG: FAD-binding oxidoreductase [Synergistaceae bacterium]|jgi:glycolate oxidase|nr:FAD-binding oxidoreductase [Synergistaceae bacterium]
MTEFGKVDGGILRALRKILGGRYVLADEDSRRQYARDRTPMSRECVADAVVLPAVAEEIASVAALANRERIPLVPRGAGSGLSGGCAPVCGGIVLSLERMNAILEYDAANRALTVEAGVLTNNIDEYLRSEPFFYAGFPMSIQDCMIGGNIATNAGGGKAVKYGVTGDHVLGLEIVTAEGKRAVLGGKNRKDVAGYDLKRLVVGSEGTLAIVTKAVLSLERRPAVTRSALFFFGENGRAAEAILRILASGQPPASLELMDRRAFSACNRYAGNVFDLDLFGPREISCAVLASYEEDSLETALRCLTEAAGRVGDLTAAPAFIAGDQRQEEDIWNVRKALAEADHLYGSVEVVGEDIVVPYASMPTFIEKLGEIESRHRGVMLTNCGHAADGNLHTTIHRMPELSSEEWGETLELLKEEIYREMRLLGGKLTGEHGVGSKRVRDFARVTDPGEMSLLRAVKKSWDPNGILNPGTIFSAESP